MDCQFIMGFFAYMYYHSFIAVARVGLGDVIELGIVSKHHSMEERAGEVTWRWDKMRCANSEIGIEP